MNNKLNGVLGTCAVFVSSMVAGNSPTGASMLLDNPCGVEVSMEKVLVSERWVTNEVLDSVRVATDLRVTNTRSGAYVIEALVSRIDLSIQEHWTITLQPQVSGRFFAAHVELDEEFIYAIAAAGSVENPVLTIEAATGEASVDVQTGGADPNAAAFAALANDVTGARTVVASLVTLFRQLAGPDIEPLTPCQDCCWDEHTPCIGQNPGDAFVCCIVRANLQKCMFECDCPSQADPAFCFRFADIAWQERILMCLEQLIDSHVQAIQ